MPALIYPRDFQQVRFLPFCYLCGSAFTSLDEGNCDGDHVPAKTIFAKSDRFPLVLKTHRGCNGPFSLHDERMGQLIGLKRGYLPSDPDRRHLRIVTTSDGKLGAVVNVNVHGAIWRWIRAFHAALYREPLPISSRAAFEVPFPSAKLKAGPLAVEPIKPQHRMFVEVIKLNRLKKNLDRIVNNNGKMKYECVWVQTDNSGPWICIFALDIYAWKDLGSPQFGQRGCAGFYQLPDGNAPALSTRAAMSQIVPPNTEPLDPFGP